MTSGSFSINNTGSSGADVSIANQTATGDQGFSNVNMDAKGFANDNLEVADMESHADSMLNTSNGLSQTAENELNTAFDTNVQSSPLQSPEKTS